MYRCEYCGKDFKKDYRKYHKDSPRFCSKKCSKGFSTKAKRKEINKKVSIALGGNGISTKTKKRKNCLCCNISLKNRQRKYCSHRCQQDYLWNKRKKEIESTGKFHKTYTNHRIHKKYLIEKHGNKCWICGNTEWLNNPIPLEVDHIDGNYANIKVDNFRLVCGNCAMLLPTYKGRNKGNGRHERRIRYKNGKSY